MSAETRRRWLAENFGDGLTDLALFERAFTHGSTGRADYQRLEFLGDRILGLVIADTLYSHFPDEPEGRLSHRLNGLVSGDVCAEVARKLDIGVHISLGKQARDDGAMDSDNVLGDIMESLIGALYLDQGLEAARSFILEHWQPLMKAARTAPKHPKSTLQEWCAAQNRKIPEYAITKKEGPPHNIRFEITVTVKGFDPVSAEAASKQAAETAAAKAFLEQHS
ncbi:MAG: ribonuclease III [Sphingorhabdus sp.]